MDRVQVLKRESASGGGDATDTQPWDEPIEAQEDAVEAAGVFLQDPSNYDEKVLISRSGNNMTFKDGINPSAVTLTDLLGGAAASLLGRSVFKVDGGMVYTSSGDIIIKEVQ